ncbi:MAG: amidohydrolase family protein [Gaiellaceae bacterium MAG52_C11]|nr:amidohydrolase family protein [Candidatus Gaiellasilicea maunaloa]
MLVIRGATVYPGSGPPRQVDVGVADGKIAAVGGELSGDVVEADGLWLCPGFIDVHAHSALRSYEEPLLTEALSQGVTTQVICPDGLAPAPVAAGRWAERRDYLRALEGPGPEEWPWTTFAEYLDDLDATRPVISLVPSIGHGAVRDTVIGGERRPATREELEEMRREVRAGFEAGATSLSFGLVYFPGAHADTEELVAVAEVAAAFGAPLVPHVRNEGAGLLEAIDEMLEVSRRSGAALHVSHLKSLAEESLIEPLLERLEAADGVTFDQYPYGAGCTLLASLLPAWAQEDGAAATLARLRDPDALARIAHDVEHGLPAWENVLGTLGPERIVADGESIADRGGEPVETVAELLLESELGVQMIMHYASEAAVRKIAAHPLMLLGSDGIFGAKPHPRVAGSAARFLGRFCLREDLLAPEEAIARLTARAADRFGLADRGRIEVGKRADLVLLDPATYVDTATYESPLSLAEGVAGGWVAGERAWAESRPTGARAGGVAR